MNTVYEALRATAARHPDWSYLAAPPRAARDYHPGGYEISFARAVEQVEALRARYYAAGYGPGHRVALMLDSRPEHFLHLWALNALGVGTVPVNSDYMAHELAYQVGHSEADLAVVLAKHEARMAAAARERTAPLPVVVWERWPDTLPRAPRPPENAAPGRGSEVAIVYTSGTTGRPKGCILDNEYCLTAGRWYAELGGKLTLNYGRERLLNPLPLYHMNAGLVTPTALILTANCLIVPDRFHPDSWWDDLVATGATAMHYLGIMPPLLMKQPPVPAEKRHKVVFALGAGIDPDVHVKFEARFGIAMVEVWGMTETGRFLANCHEPRLQHTRAFGRPTSDFLAKAVDDHDREVPRGTPGELVVRDAGPDPRRAFFRGYLKDAKATEEAWRGGWFHTGDVVTQDETGMFYFVERKKNIIRRSGENISAAEIENALIEHPAVAQVAVLAVPDELRDEEVMACVVASPGHAAGAETARAIFESARGKIAYYKLPGWIVFVESLPRTGTQKIQKGLIFPKDSDPRAHPGAIDLRAHKKREKAA